MATRESDRAFRDLVRSEDNRRSLRKRLGLESDQTLSPRLVALAQKLQKELERREQEMADENPLSA
ncbi:hypothetical protein [Mesorhizobium sp.]|uniref:hypothetical protein n=1 Tax=Mesorhizobium sp. TaxID=1871066 RepID=UPI000FE37AA7|nr:hypothetical protein [Mesorhizobium sp.]RWO21990.1 MAG: hypothetical protein EOS09_21955 [Mesorhizobium sp.]RWO43370.1 MAG: hypothetical protein EOS13_30800 [Mesorhizobium sp.]TIM41681.1 MAG: hypothetical protein E5Y56_22015 [Mesorhizobium sp.]TIN28074.1 MAG: hypothetical protein E5Y19_08690 [Mesorhizobium sp.]TIN33677.1 MAG: hypothetical protein E5Y13_31720 [Mesorhizobium sp.]